MGLADILGKGARKFGQYMSAARRAQFYGEDVDSRYIPAMRDELQRALAKDEEDRQAKREERKAREEERAYMRELREQQQEERTRLNLDRKRSDYVKAASMARVVTPSGKVFLNTNAIAPSDLDDEERSALNLGLVRDTERELGEQNRKREETLADKMEQRREQERLMRLGVDLGVSAHERKARFDLANPKPSNDEGKVTQRDMDDAYAILQRGKPLGAPPPTKEEVFVQAQDLAEIRGRLEGTRGVGRSSGQGGSVPGGPMRPEPEAPLSDRLGGLNFSGPQAQPQGGAAEATPIAVNPQTGDVLYSDGSIRKGQ